MLIIHVNCSWVFLITSTRGSRNAFLFTYSKQPPTTELRTKRLAGDCGGSPSSLKIFHFSSFLRVSYCFAQLGSCWPPFSFVHINQLLTVPLIFGSLVGSILPTSQVIILVTGSNEYFPWFGVRVTFRIDFGNNTSTTTFSIWNENLKTLKKMA